MKTFDARDTHAWPPQLMVPDSWAEPYAAAIEEIDRALPATVEAAADEARAFIAEIDAATTPCRVLDVDRHAAPADRPLTLDRPGAGARD
jgi:hypothetical protein